MKVHVLPDHIINKIAAGEVVERPASVVRELVENSVDAGATEISVFIENGGHSLVLVKDNGSGMARADALLALERHATSKIQGEEDLAAINSLGFRGEALPSIASVSRVTLRSCLAGSDTGTEIKISGGKILNVSACAMPHGTEIEVRHLFYNVPARRKFLRSPRYEEQRVKDWLLATSLSKPEVKFRLYSDGKEVFNLATRATILERAQELIHGSTLSFSIQQPLGTTTITLSGIVGHPSQARADTSGFHLLVNNRVVHDRSILKAVKEGFLTTLKDKEFPLGFLDIRIDPSQVDVNVHPQKNEVRFRETRAIFMIVKETVSRVVRDFRAPLQTNYQSNYLQERTASLPPSGPVRVPVSSYATPVPGAQRNLQLAEVTPASSLYQTPPAPPPSLHVITTAVDARPAPALEFKYVDLRYIGQLLECYLLCEFEQKFYIVDMHAAHERCNYNRIREAARLKSHPSQQLLVPLDLQLGEVGADRLLQETELLTRFGFNIEAGSASSVIVRGVPSGYRLDALMLIKEMAAALPDEMGSSALEEQIDHVAARLACHASIRSGEDLQRPEVYELFKQLDQAELSSACPHGRPVIVSFSHADVEHWFGRDR